MIHTSTSFTFPAPPLPASPPSQQNACPVASKAAAIAKRTIIKVDGATPLQKDCEGFAIPPSPARVFLPLPSQRPDYESLIEATDVVLESLQWLKAARAGDLDAQFTLGKFLFKKKSIQQGIEWLQIAAERDCIPAIFALGTYYRAQNSLQEKMKGAFYLGWAFTNAKTDSSFPLRSMYYLGSIFDHFCQNRELAKTCYEYAALQLSKCPKNDDTRQKYTIRLCKRLNISKIPALDKSFSKQQLSWFFNHTSESLILKQIQKLTSQGSAGTCFNKKIMTAALYGKLCALIPSNRDLHRAEFLIHLEGY